IWKNDMSGETGWFIQSTGSLTGGGNGLTYNADAGATATVGVYSYGTGTGTDRALGAITGGSGAMSVAFGLLLYNNSGAPVTSLGVSYTGEQWRSASTSAQTLQFTYAIAAGTSGKFYNTDGAGATGYLSPGVTSGPDTAGDNKGLNWVSASAGNFTSPNLTGSGAIAGGASTAINFTLTGLSIPAGSSIMLRWLDPSGNTDGLGIDNVCLSIPVPEPSTYMAGGAVLAMIGATAWRRRSQKQA
ncbi:MAG TPA: PEP-CTERM sorting domain-containing protein, partial [Candidatus Limnocylindria bacterium]|nr:PEP-CTERM sorting domain-containing protein [Candidatus Limnocylindria bacterium]